MSKLFFDRGDYITDEKGEKRFCLEEPANFNEKFYVVRAQDLQSGERCLLKFVVSSDSAYKVNNLQREGNFRFQYPFIEKVFGNFKGFDPNGDPVFGVAVEYISGDELLNYRPDLERRIRHGKINEEEAEKGIFRQMLQFLYGMNYYSQYAGQNYLHRDLKPENVMITADGTVKIVDFDYAHIAGSDKTINLAGWEVPFSKGYTSPELMELPAGERSGNLRMDLYSAGRVLFYWLNGRHYYSNEQMSRTGDDISSTGYFAKEELRYGFEANAERFDPKYFLPKYRKLMRILNRMCADPGKGQCYSSVAEIIQDMKQFLVDYYEQSPGKMEAAIRIEEFPLLQGRVNQNTRRFVMAAWKVPGGPKIGKPLYEYTMRDIVVDGRLLMTLCNCNNVVTYIPALGVKVRRERRGDDHEVRNKDVFICDAVELEFTVTEGRTR